MISVGYNPKCQGAFDEEILLNSERWTRLPCGIDTYEGICDRGEKLYGHLPCLETRSRSVLSEMRGRGESDGGLEEEVKGRKRGEKEKKK